MGFQKVANAIARDVFNNRSLAVYIINSEKICSCRPYKCLSKKCPLCNVKYHWWLSEFVTQSCVLMYCNLWNICKVISHHFSSCLLDQVTFKEAKWHVGSKFG
jgi:hypothetical protein